MRLCFAMGLALVVVSCSNGSRDGHSPPHREQRETSADELPALQPPITETWEPLLDELFTKADPPGSLLFMLEKLSREAESPESLPVTVPTQGRIDPPRRVIDPTYPPSFLFQDPPIRGPWRHPNLPPGDSMYRLRHSWLRR